MIFLYLFIWVLIGFLSSIWIAKFFSDGISLFGVISCCVLGPFSTIAPIVWILADIRIF